jgi:hypothetical protein
MPARLRCFDPADWPDDERADDDALPYGYEWSWWWSQPPQFRARWRWRRARTAWSRSNGVDILEMLREQVHHKQADATLSVTSENRHRRR